eukprot:GGOE01057067.1.p1 GENE.GGOE01057067.1~~GGOE01057067.1.p1  ORF type:complete len:146 (-),score=51.33 GGOE01057067.1:106-543(-)
MADALPRAQVLRVAKAALPEGYRLDDSSKTAVSNAAVAFVLRATCHALDAAKRSKRSTITKQDVLSALEEMGLEHFLPQLEHVVAKRAKQAGTAPPAANDPMDAAEDPTEGAQEAASDAVVGAEDVDDGSEPPEEADEDSDAEGP